MWKAIVVCIVIFVIVSWILQPRRYFLLKNGSYPKVASDVINKTAFASDKYVGSMTTTPDRINLIRPSIYSMLDQSVQLHKIHVNIPYMSRKGVAYEVPQWLEEIPRVQVFRVDEDLGPGTKVLPTLQRALNNEDGLTPTTPIVVFDDDIIYNTRTVEKLISKFLREHRNKAVTNYGVEVDHKNVLPNNFQRIVNFARRSTNTDLLQGFSGFVVKASMFPPQIFDFSIAPKEAICVDDVWLSGWLAVNGVEVVTSGSTLKAFPLINVGDMRETISLSKTDNKEFVTDLTVIDWFKTKYKVW